MVARISLCFALLAGMLASIVSAGGTAFAQADADAGTYTDSVYLYSFSWDPDLYDATDIVGDDDVPYGVTLQNDLEYGSLSVGGYASPRRCLTERSDVFTEIEGVSKFEEVDDLDLPKTDPDARAGLYRYEFENPDTGDVGEFVQYFECRDLLIEGEPVEDVVLTFDMGVEEASYEDVVGAWEDILASIEWDAEAGSNSNPNNNGSDAPGYVDPTYGWGLSWDDAVLTGEEWIPGDDDVVAGIQLTAESGGFFTAFSGEFSSARTCVNDQAASIEGDSFSNFEEDETSDLPETSEDARAALYTGVFTASDDSESDIYLYVECRQMIVDDEEVEDQFLVVNAIGTVADYEDDAALWSDVLLTIAFDVEAGGGGNENPDPNGNGGDSGIDGDTYISALGYQFSWDDSIFTGELLDEDNPDRGVILSSDGSYITIQVAGDPDAAACVEAEVSVIEGFDGVSRLTESDKDGPRTARGSEGGLFEGTLTTTDGAEGDITVYIECRPLAETDDTPLFIVVSMIGFGDLYEDEEPAWENILDSIEITE